MPDITKNGNALAGAGRKPSAKSMSSDLYKKYEKSYKQYQRTGNYGDTSWMKKEEVDLFNNIRKGNGKSALSNGKYYYMDNDTYDKYGKSRASWATSGDYGDTSWMNQHDVDAYNAIRGSRSKEDNAFDDFRYSLDDDIVKSVQDKYKSQWGDKYYYDITDMDDVARMNAGQMPKYLANKYNANDPYDKWLYENGLPYSSEFNDMYSQAVADYNENLQKEAEKQQAEYEKQKEEYEIEKAYLTAETDFRNNVYKAINGMDPDEVTEDTWREVIANVYESDPEKYQEVIGNFDYKNGTEDEIIPGSNEYFADVNKKKKEENKRQFTVTDLMTEYQGLLDKAQAEAIAELPPEQQQEVTQQLKEQETREKQAKLSQKLRQIDAEIARLGASGWNVDSDRMQELIRQRKDTNDQLQEQNEIYNADRRADKTEEMLKVDNSMSTGDIEKRLTELNIKLAGYRQTDGSYRETDESAALIAEKEDLESKLTLTGTAGRSLQNVNQFLADNGGTDEIADVSSWSRKNSNKYKALTGQKKGLANLPKYATAEEIAGANAAALQGEEVFTNYIEDLETVLKSRATLARTEKTEALAQQDAVGASVLSVGANFLSAAEGVGNIASSLATGYGNAVDMAYAGFMTSASKEIRSTVSEDIIINNSNQTVLPGVSTGEIYSFLYQSGMSMLDTAARLPMGGAGLAVAGLSAADATILDQLESGATTREAVALGVVAGFAEIITEKVSLENLMTAKSAGTVKQLIREVIKQSGIEATEEMASEVINILAEAIVLEDNDFTVGGILKRIGEAGLGGLVSGFGFGAAGQVARTARAGGIRYMKDVSTAQKITEDLIGKNGRKDLFGRAGEVSKFRVEYMNAVAKSGFTQETQQNLYNMMDQMELDYGFAGTKEGQAIIKNLKNIVDTESTNHQILVKNFQEEQTRNRNRLAKMLEGLTSLAEQAKGMVNDPQGHSQIYNEFMAKTQEYQEAEQSNKTKEDVANLKLQEAERKAEQKVQDAVEKTATQYKELASIMQETDSAVLDEAAFDNDVNYVKETSEDAIKEAKVSAMERGDERTYNLLEDMLEAKKSGDDNQIADYVAKNPDIIEMMWQTELSDAVGNLDTDAIGQTVNANKGSATIADTAAGEQLSDYEQQLFNQEAIDNASKFVEEQNAKEQASKPAPKVNLADILNGKGAFADAVANIDKIKGNINGQQSNGRNASAEKAVTQDSTIRNNGQVRNAVASEQTDTGSNQQSVENAGQQEITPQKQRVFAPWDKNAQDGARTIERLYKEHGINLRVNEMQNVPRMYAENVTRAMYFIGQGNGTIFYTQTKDSDDYAIHGQCYNGKPMVRYTGMDSDIAYLYHEHGHAYKQFIDLVQKSLGRDYNKILDQYIKTAPDAQQDYSRDEMAEEMLCDLFGLFGMHQVFGAEAGETEYINQKQMQRMFDYMDNAMADTAFAEDNDTVRQLAPDDVYKLSDRGIYTKEQDDSDREALSTRTVDAWAKRMKKEHGSSEKVARIISQVEDMRDYILNDKSIAQYAARGDIPTNKMGPLVNNQEYTLSFDVDANCERRMQYAAYLDQVQQRLGRLLTLKECRQLVELMRACDQMIPCTYCYVEGKRMQMSNYTLNFLNTRRNVLNAATDEDALPLMYSYNKDKGTISAAAQKVFDTWRSLGEGAYNPTVSEHFYNVQYVRNQMFDFLDEKFGGEKRYKDVDQGRAKSYKPGVGKKKMLTALCNAFNISSTGPAFKQAEAFFNAWYDDMLQRVPHVRQSEFPAKQQQSPMAAFLAQRGIGTEDSGNVWDLTGSVEDILTLERDASSYAKSASQARNIDRYRPYTANLRDVSAEDKKNINARGGLRVHSSNDFQIQNVLDYMQLIGDMDMLGGWYGHTYTKNGDFVRIFGNTGYKFNMSIAMLGDNTTGIRENHQEGMYWSEANDLRNKFKNAGVMAMVVNDDQLSFALNSDWIDMIIPFHASGMEKEYWYNVLQWEDYTRSQNERFLTSDAKKAGLEQFYSDADKTSAIEENFDESKKAAFLKKNGVANISELSSEQLNEMFNKYLSSMSSDELDEFYRSALGIKEILVTKNVTNDDGTKSQVKSRKVPHFLPYEQVIEGQVIPGHNNDQETYLRLCREYGVKPRFDGVMVDDGNGNKINIVDHPNYFKVIKETSRTDSPQEYVKANYTEEQINHIKSALKSFANIHGYENMVEDPFGIVPTFLEEYAGKNRDYLDEDGNVWLPEKIKRTAELIHGSTPVENAVSVVHRRLIDNGYDDLVNGVYVEHSVKQSNRNIAVNNSVDSDEDADVINLANRDIIVNGPDGKPVQYAANVRPDKKSGTDYGRAFFELDENGNPLKTVETRPRDTLKNLVNGRWQAVSDRGIIPGFIKLGNAVEYSDPDEFRMDYDRHRIEPGSEFDWTWDDYNNGKRRFWYPILETQRLDNEIRTPKGATELRSSKRFTEQALSNRDIVSDTEYKNLARKYEAEGNTGDNYYTTVRPLERMVEQAAKQAGYTTPKLFHGTPRFGWTVYDRSKAGVKNNFIFASSRSEVAANYGGDKNLYAGQRDIGQKYDGGDSLESIIKDARWLDRTAYEKPSREKMINRIVADINKVERITDEINALPDIYDLNLPKDIKDEVYNAMAPSWVKDVDAFFNKSVEEGATDILDDVDIRNGFAEAVNDFLNLYYRAKPVLQEYYDNHRNELGNNERELLGYLVHSDLLDIVADIESGSGAIANGPDRVLKQKSADRFVNADALREQLENENDIGASYQWYGDVGNNPFEVDANDGSWVAIKVPQMNNGYYSTDEIAKWALDNGYTSVIIRNVYDGGIKADDYIFFNSNQIKSADPVTYDDNGEIIPLSERFNKEEPDIRESSRIIPTGSKRSQEVARQAGELFDSGVTLTDYYNSGSYDNAVAAQLRGLMLRNGQRVGGKLSEQEVENIIKDASNWKKGNLYAFKAPVRIFQNVGKWHDTKSKNAAAYSQAVARNMEADAFYSDTYYTYMQNKLAEENVFKQGVLEKINDLNPTDQDAILAQLIGEKIITPEMAQKVVMDKKHILIPVGNGAMVLDKKGRVRYMADNQSMLLFTDDVLKKAAERARKINEIRNDDKPGKDERINALNKDAGKPTERLGVYTLKVDGDHYSIVNEATGESVFDMDGESAYSDTSVELANTLSAIYGSMYDSVQSTLVENGYAPIGHIENYFPHFSQAREGVAGMIDYLKSEDLPAGIAGLTPDFSPGKPWARNLLSRLGDKTDYNAVRGFEGYLNGVSDVIYMTPVIQRFRQLESALRTGMASKTGEQHSVNEANTNFLRWLHDYTNQLANKKPMVDRGVEETFGRKVYTLPTKLSGWIGMSYIGGNLRTALTNVAALAQGSGQLDPKWLGKGLFNTAVTDQSEFGDDFRNVCPFLINRQSQAEEVAMNLGDKFRQKGEKILFGLIEAVDNFSTETIARAKYYELTQGEGLSPDEAMKETSKWCVNLFAERSKGSRATIFNSKVLSPLTQFQIEPFNQLWHWSDIHNENLRSEYRRILKENNGKLDGIDWSKVENQVNRVGVSAKDLRKILGRMIALSIYGMIMRTVTGSDATWNPVGIVIDMVNGYKKDGVEGAVDAVKDNVMDNIPFASLIEMVGSAVGLGDDEFGSSASIPIPALSAVNSAVDAAKVGTPGAYLEGLSYLAPGGGQMRKTAKGIRSYLNEGDYNKKGKLRYPIEQTPFNAIRAAVFGASAVKPSDYEYGTVLGEKETAAYDQAVSQGVDKQDAYNFLLNDYQAANNTLKLASLATSDLDDSEMRLMADILGIDVEKGSIQKQAVNSVRKAQKDLQKRYDKGTTTQVNYDEKMAAYDAFLEELLG